MVWYTQIEKPEDEDKKQIAFYKNAAITGFLDDTTSEVLFITGLKGVGKTLLLRYKSAANRRRFQGVTFVPQTELAETLQTVLTSLGEKGVSNLSRWPYWLAIWRTVLTTVIARAAGIPLPDAVAELFPTVKDTQNTSVFSHLSSLLASGELSQFLHSIFPKLDAQLTELLSKCHSGVHVFVDAIDELVLLHHGIPLMQHELQQQSAYGHLSPDVWSAAQIGFVKASRDIHRNFRHIRIYGAFRYEALERYMESDRQNLDPHILRVEYSGADLRSMFRAKLDVLARLNPEVFVRPDGDLVERFFGFATIRHPNVLNPNRTQYEEDALTFLIRHTRGRPRELDDLGRGLQAIAPADRTHDTVRDRVRLRSREFFLWAKTEAIPYWDEKCDKFLKQLKSNWISRSDLGAVRIPGGKEEAFEQLFLNGLLGCTVRAFPNNGLEARFRQFDPSAPVSIEEFRHAQYFVVHPCAGLATFFEKSDYAADPWNVAGHVEKFHQVDNRGHVHIGAGALGLGCVVPLFSEVGGVGLCVLQRSGNEKWDRLAKNSDQLTIEIVYLNMGSHPPHTVSFTVIHRPKKSRKEKAWIAEWRRGERNLFVIADPNDDSLAGNLLSQATSVSTAVKGRNLPQISDLLHKYYDHNRMVYLFENDDTACRKLMETLPDTHFAEVCADQICMTPKVSDNGQKITVQAESYKSIIIHDASKVSNEFFPGETKNKNVEIVGDALQFEFKRLRKLTLVNGLHYFFALAALKYLMSITPGNGQAIESVIGSQATAVLARTDEVRKTLDIAGELFVLQLLLQAEEWHLISDDESLRELRMELDAQQAQVIDRVLAIPDRLNRILNTKDEDFRSKGHHFVAGVMSLQDNVGKSRLLRNQFREGHEDLKRKVDRLHGLYFDKPLSQFLILSLGR